MAAKLYEKPPVIPPAPGPTERAAGRGRAEDAGGGEAASWKQTGEAANEGGRGRLSP